jgi:hypothetical protein
MSTASRFLLFSLGVICGLVIAGCLAAIAPGMKPADGPAIAAVAVSALPLPTAPLTYRADPWPECSLIREWLAENMPNPKATYVVLWKKRDVHGPTVSVIVSIRTPNRQGVMTDALGDFKILVGQITRGVVSDQQKGWSIVARRLRDRQPIIHGIEPPDPANIE